MDSVSGGGSLRVKLLDADTLEGEFMENLGRFTARRAKAKRLARQDSGC
jgi:hypothetical protein